MRPRIDPEAPRRNAWTERLIEAINEGTGVEAWQAKDAMRFRVEIEFDPRKVEKQDQEAAEDATEPGSGDDGESANQVSVNGFATFDLRRRLMRFDHEEGMSFLVGDDGVAIWRCESGDEAPSRDDVPDEALDMARVLRYVLIMPLWINEEEGIMVPGGLRHLQDIPYYSAAYVLRDRDATFGRGAANGDDDAVSTPPALPQYPTDWYAFFSDTHIPHRIDAIAFLVHDRSRPPAESTLPRLIYFDELEEIEGVAISRVWRIHAYSRAGGLGEQIGRARVPAVEFVERDPEVFAVPENALRVR